jgi:ABC-type multidrug transport system fused ATPase/permease subunit
MEKGKVAEQGSHSKLMYNKATYFKLWMEQFPVVVDSI